jgi:putative addiction module CopG family antidote
MQLTLDAKTSQLIEERIQSGQYSSAEGVVMAALHALEMDESEMKFAPDELDALIEEGDASEDLKGEDVFAEFRQLREQATKNGHP